MTRALLSSVDSCSFVHVLSETQLYPQDASEIGAAQEEGHQESVWEEDEPELEEDAYASAQEVPTPNLF